MFFVIQGSWKFYLDNGSEEVIDVQVGSIIYIPAGIWHQLENNDSQDMVASQCTKSGAGWDGKPGAKIESSATRKGLADRFSVMTIDLWDKNFKPIGLSVQEKFYCKTNYA